MSFLGSVRVVEADEHDPRHPSTRFAAHIDDDWGIVYSQGGVVFAVMLRAAELALGRDDLRPVSANATYIRPVRCGPLVLDVHVLRSGRNGAQMCITAHDPHDEDPTPNVQATLVCAAHDPTMPTFDGLTTPFDASVPPPQDCARVGLDADGHPSMAFFRRTEWRDATPPDDAHLHRRSWFRFSDEPGSPVHGSGPDGAWDVALLPIPADALGMAATQSASEVVGPLTSPTLELSLQFVSPARGTWIGIESHCSRSDGGIISGVASLWNTDGSLIATAAQTALLRRLPKG